MKRNVSIDDILQPLQQVTSQAYLSNAVQVADILEWILQQVGRAEVWQSSFSISEEFLRRLHTIRERGELRKLHLLLDRKATNKTVKLWHFIAQCSDHTYLADNHSKILLVQAESGARVAVVTSQNLTRGNRAESAFLTTDPAIFQTLLQQLQALTRSAIEIETLLR
jgi:hypothetical protein